MTFEKMTLKLTEARRRAAKARPGYGKQVLPGPAQILEWALAVSNWRNAHTILAEFKLACQGLSADDARALANELFPGHRPK